MLTLLRFTRYAAATLLATMLAATVAQAGDYLSFNAGEYDTIRQDHTAAQFGVEYRFDEIEYGFHPMVGAYITSRDAKYAYAGFDWAVALLPNRLYLMPSFAVGAYSKGNGKDLGGTLEFRSGIEVDYQFDNAQQFGIGLNHLSNAGIYKHNSGVEEVMATYSIPISTIGSWMGR